MQVKPHTTWPIAIALLAFITACATKNEQIDRDRLSAKARQETAMRMWKERCETKAGIKIYRTVENVDGIFLMKIRPGGVPNYGDQFKLDDPYGSDSTDDRYILNFLKGFYHQQPDVKVTPGNPPRAGFSYVEAVDPNDGQRYRYTGRIEEPWQTNKSYLKGYTRFVFDKEPSSGPPPRYGVTYDDISTHEEREYWIAGSSLRVIDLVTNEVIAERIGYMVDWAQGSTAGFRSPWLFAADNACPDFNSDNLRRVPGPGSSAQASQTIVFVEKVLKPSK